MAERALVTGAAGFIGSHVVRALLDDGVEVHAMSSSVSSELPPRLADIAREIHVVEANITDRSSMEHVARTVRPTHVLHLAAFTHVGKSFHRVGENVMTNIAGTVNLLEALQGEYERFVYTGTSEIYGDVEVPFREDGPVNPVSPYSVSKYAGEGYCRMFHQAYAWPIACLRPFNAYGPWQTPDRVIPEIILSGLLGRPLRMTKGEQTREFNFVGDIAAAFVKAMRAPGIDGEIINVGCGVETSMRDLATTIVDLLGNPVEPEYGALDYRPTEIWRMYADARKAERLLDWRPAHTLREGLDTTIGWYRQELERGSRFLIDATR